MQPGNDTRTTDGSSHVPGNTLDYPCYGHMHDVTSYIVFLASFPCSTEKWGEPGIF